MNGNIYSGVNGEYWNRINRKKGLSKYFADKVSKKNEEPEIRKLGLQRMDLSDSFIHSWELFRLLIQAMELFWCWKWSIVFGKYFINLPGNQGPQILVELWSNEFLHCGKILSLFRLFSCNQTNFDNEYGPMQLFSLQLIAKHEIHEQLLLLWSEIEWWKLINWTLNNYRYHLAILW